MMPKIAGAFFLYVFLALQCFAGDVSIRLVEATDDRQAGSDGLADIVAVLKQNLKYANYRLVAACTVHLPAANGTEQLGPYKIRCDGPQNNLAVAVSRNGKDVLKTAVFLQAGKPFMLGGLPGKTGKLILVFVLQ